jgi:transketolase
MMSSWRWHWRNWSIRMRNAFIDELVKAADAYDRIVLVVGDLGYGVVEPFAKRFPKRFFNAGVAEQNMMSLSAGLASEGFQVFVYSIANFPTFRCAEQIRNDVDYHNLPVTVVTVGGGLAYGNLGYSHHAVQDYALMRVMPNMLIAAPGDPMEVRACMRYLIGHPQPSYLRLGKAGEPKIHAEVPQVAPGKWLDVRRGEQNGLAYLTTGAPLDLVNHLLANSPDLQGYSLCSMPLWSMKVKAEQAAQLENYSTIVTVEDHLTDGGFGSWLLEAASARPDLISRIKIRALNSVVCGMVGKQATLNAEGGLSEQSLCG